MKKLLWPIVALISLIFVGCSKNPVEKPDDGKDPQPFVVKCDKTVTMPSEGGSFSVSLSSPLSWEMSVLNDRAKDWISFSKSSGAEGDYEVKVSVAANKEYDSREATVRIKTSGDDVFDIVVSQKCAEALTASASRNDFTAEGGTLTITVNANIDFTYQISADCADWVSEVTTKALTTTTLNFAIAENKRVSARSGSVVISSSKGKETIRINQAAFIPSIVVSKTQVPMGAEGGEFSVDVTSNMDATVTVNVPWIHETATKSTSTNSFSFSVDPSSEYESRIGTVTFAAGGVTQQVKVEQQPQTALMISMSEYTADAAGENIEVIATSNQPVSAVASDPWLSVITTKSLIETQMVIGILPNTSLSERSGTVTFTSGDGTKSQVLKVKQHGEAVRLWASQETLTLPVDGNDQEALILGNVEFTTEIVGNEDGWFHISITDAADSREPFSKLVSVGARRNDAGVFRSCSVKFSNEAAGVSGILNIVQDIPSGMAVVSNGGVIPKEGGEFMIVLAVASDQIAQMTLPSWISQIQTKSVTLDTLRFRAEPTPFKYERRSTLTIKAESENIIQFEITQEGDASKAGVPDDEIWYTGFDDAVIDFDCVPGRPFDQDVVSVTYQDGMGKVKLAGPVKNVLDYAFAADFHIIFDVDYNVRYIHDVYLPDCVQTIGWRSFLGLEMETFMVPADLVSVGADAFYHCGISRFVGKSASADGKGIVIGETYFLFAPAADDQSYTIPQGVTEIARGAFSKHKNLKSISFPEGIKTIGQDAFSDCSLEYVTLPSSLQTIDYLAFSGNNVKKFSGASKFVSADGLYLQDDDPEGVGKVLLLFANGSGLENYNIPEGVSYLDSYSFAGNKDLKFLSLPSSFRRVAGEAFKNATALRGVYGSHVSADNRAIVVNGDLQYVVPAGLKNFYVDGTVKTISGQSITHSESLESIVIHDGVTRIGMYAFSNNPKLTSITLPASLVSLGYDPFMSSPELTDVWVRSVDPPTIDIIYRDQQSKKVKYHVPSESLERYKKSAYWQPLADVIVGYDYTDLPGSTSAYYASTDYSADGRVKTLQKASVGKGIDIVLMGDGYTDAMIADGTYDAALRRMYDVLFAEEPLKSYRDRFNVYQVDVVSKNGLIADDALTALNTKFVVGTEVGGSDAVVQNYAKAVVSDMDEALLVVLMNEKNQLGGTCYMYDGAAGKYGSGLSICYFSDIQDPRLFSNLVNHESIGHGFGKLGDEYAYEYMGKYIPGTDNSLITHELMGWFKNVDVNGDPAKIKWAKFIADSRYANDGVGVFEGAFTYWTGIYRPSDFSTMRYNDGGFNAPSREAIWCRIQHLSNGPDWVYDYEDFVRYDAVNLERSAMPTTMAKRGSLVLKTAQHCPPFLKGKR